MTLTYPPGPHDCPHAPHCSRATGCHDGTVPSSWAQLKEGREEAPFTAGTVTISITGDPPTASPVIVCRDPFATVMANAAAAQARKPTTGTLTWFAHTWRHPRETKMHRSERGEPMDQPPKWARHTEP